MQMIYKKTDELAPVDFSIIKLAAEESVKWLGMAESTEKLEITFNGFNPQLVTYMGDAATDMLDRDPIQVDIMVLPVYRNLLSLTHEIVHVQQVVSGDWKFVDSKIGLANFRGADIDLKKIAHAHESKELFKNYMRAPHEVEARDKGQLILKHLAENVFTEDQAARIVASALMVTSVSQTAVEAMVLSMQWMDNFPNVKRTIEKRKKANPLFAAIDEFLKGEGKKILSGIN